MTRWPASTARSCFMAARYFLGCEALLLRNRDAFERIALFDRVHHILALANLAENGVFSVQPIGDHGGDEKLAAVGIWTRVRHRQRADLVLVRVALGFILETVTRTSAAGAGRIAALNHEVLDDAMKQRAVIKFFPREKNKIVHGFWRILGKQVADDFPARGIKRGGIFLGRIDGHRRRSRILFWHRFILSRS